MHEQSSFRAVKSWIRELKQVADTDIVLAIAGNKCDLEDLREIQYKGLTHFSVLSLLLTVSTAAAWAAMFGF